MYKYIHVQEILKVPCAHNILLITCETIITKGINVILREYNSE